MADEHRLETIVPATPSKLTDSDAAHFFMVEMLDVLGKLGAHLDAAKPDQRGQAFNTAKRACNRFAHPERAFALLSLIADVLALGADPRCAIDATAWTEIRELTQNQPSGKPVDRVNIRRGHDDTIEGYVYYREYLLADWDPDHLIGKVEGSTFYTLREGESA